LGGGEVHQAGEDRSLSQGTAAWSALPDSGDPGSEPGGEPGLAAETDLTELDLEVTP